MVLMQSLNGRQLLRWFLRTAREAPSMPRPRLRWGSWLRTSSLQLAFNVRVGWPRLLRLVGTQFGFCLFAELETSFAHKTFPGQRVRLL